MNSIGRLGEFYGLSPATMAGLANVAGAQPPVDNYESEFAADQEEQRKFAAENGLPEVTPLVPPPAADDGSRMYTDPSANSKATGQTGVQLYGGPLGDMGADASKAPPPGASAPGVAPAPAAQPQSYMPAPAPAVTVPAHWQPGTHAVSVQHGIPTEALEPGKQSREDALVHGVAAADLHRAAAMMQGEIDGAYAASRARVEQNTADQLQALQARKNQLIADERSKLETLNAEASKKVDTNEAFVGGDVGRLGAAIAMGIGQFASIWKGGTNAAMQIVNDAVDSTIKRQQANISNARGAISERRNLLKDNLDAVGDEERGVLATKMQLLNAITADAEARHANGPKAVENEAQYNDFMAALKGKYAEYQDRYGEATSAKVGEQMNEHFVPAQTFGGAGAATKREGNLVTLSDGTSFVMPNEDTAKKSIEKIQVLDKLQRNNNEIKQLRAKAERLDPVLNYTDYKATMQQLRDLGEAKVALTSLALGQGVVKEEEYKRAQEISVGVTNGLGFFKGNPAAKAEREATDAMLDAQTKRWGEDQRSFVTAAGGSVYERGYTTDANGQLKPVGRYTGQDATPTEHLSPNGAKPLDNRRTIQTAGPKTSTKIPYGPMMGSPPARAPAPVPVGKKKR